MKNELLPYLRKELENSFGRKVLSSRDCLQMVDDIYQKTGYTINANTLRRFFGLVKSNYSASPSTLSILLKYCGLNSTDDLKNISAPVSSQGNINKEEVHHFLVGLFKNLPHDENSPVIDSLIQQTVHFLDRNPDLIERFQREIANTHAGQFYYFERAVNMDRLNGYYGDGLRHYQRAGNSNESTVFANALLVFRYWLTGNTELVERTMASLSAIPVNNSFPVHIMARYFAARLYYAHAKSESLDKLLSEISRYYSGFVSKAGLTNSDFELVMAEALTLTGHYPEASEYLKRGRSRLGVKKSSESDASFGFWEKIISSRRIPSIKVIISPQRQNMSAVIPPSPLTRKYHTLLYLLANSARSKKANYDDLLRETGFTRLV